MSQWYSEPRTLASAAVRISPSVRSVQPENISFLPLNATSSNPSNVFSVPAEYIQGRRYMISIAGILVIGTSNVRSISVPPYREA